PTCATTTSTGGGCSATTTWPGSRPTASSGAPDPTTRWPARTRASGVPGRHARRGVRGGARPGAAVHEQVHLVAWADPVGLPEQQHLLAPHHHQRHAGQALADALVAAAGVVL